MFKTILPPFVQGEPGTLVTTGVTWLASLNPTQSSQLGPQVRGGGVERGWARALAAGGGDRAGGSARVEDTHRAAGQSFPRAPAEHGRALPARSAVG